MNYILIISLLLVIGCTNAFMSKKASAKKETQDNLIAVMDTTWHTEQVTIRLRDSLMGLYGVDSKEVK